ncbi:unnamed protein product [Rhodiola kirilowii]
MQVFLQAGCPGADDDLEKSVIKCKLGGVFWRIGKIISFIDSSSINPPRSHAGLSK